MCVGSVPLLICQRFLALGPLLISIYSDVDKPFPCG